MCIRDRFLSSALSLKYEDIKLSERIILPSNRLRGFEKGKVGPVDGTDHIGGNYAAAINFEAQLPKFLPESSNTDVGLFLDFGNIWGGDYDSSIDDSNKLRSSTGMAASWLSPVGPMTFIFSSDELLAEFSLSHLRRTSSLTLSGGERRMVSIGRGMMSEAKLYMADEPTLGLAPKIGKGVLEALLKIDLKDSAMIIAEQNVALLEGKVDRIIGMHAGKLKGEASSSLSMGLKN